MRTIPVECRALVEVDVQFQQGFSDIANIDPRAVSEYIEVAVEPGDACEHGSDESRHRDQKIQITSPFRDEQLGKLEVVSGGVFLGKIL